MKRSRKSRRPLPSENPQNVPMNVLMVEDDDQYFGIINLLLSHCRTPRFVLTRVSTLSAARDLLAWKTPDVILLDMKLPDSEGLATLKTVRQEADGAPIVILTGIDDQEIGLKSVAEGAHDYLIKQRVSNESLIRCLRYAMERRRGEQTRERLAAIEDFTAALAHDLRTPLIGANNLLSLLLSGSVGELNPEQERVLVQLSAANDGQRRLVDKLLEIYKFESKEELYMTDTSVKEIITKCIGSMTDSFTDVEVRLNVSDDLPNIRGDENALQQMFHCLLDNAFKFRAEGTPIEISAELYEDLIAVHVHNLGKCIPPEVQNCLFDKFWHGVPGRLYVAHTGLGLYLCRRIAVLHGGKIHCKSDEQHGTTFSVVLRMA